MSTKTVNLTANEITKAEFDSGHRYIWCNNLSDKDVLISEKSNFARGDDDVTIVTPGSSASLGDVGGSDIKTVYLIGSGEVQLKGTGSAHNPFKSRGKGGGDGGAETVAVFTANTANTDILSGSLYEEDTL